MFKGHPKGLYVLALSNMGERFGYYTMLAIFTLFIEAKLGLSQSDIGQVWGIFLAAVYALPLIGGFLADRMGYGKVVIAGIIVMFIGYLLLSYPPASVALLFSSLFIIALGTGLFKGNMVVLLGNLYEDPKYNKLQDTAFNIYYMGINVGAFFAPFAAVGMRDLFLKFDNFTYDANIPRFAHNFLKDPVHGLNAESLVKFKQIAMNMTGTTAIDLHSFSNQYLTSLSKAYNMGFAIAAAAIIVSFIIFIAFKKYYKHVDVIHKKSERAKTTVELTPKQTKDRIVALVLVFITVIFFWMAFHQNGLVLTYIAKNYTAGAVSKLNYILFDLPALLSLIAVIMGIIFLILKSSTALRRGIGAVLAIAGAIILTIRYNGFGEINKIGPETFQAFNPIFVVFLTPVVIAFFAMMARKGKEISSPRKIGFGMFIAAIAYVILVVAALIGKDGGMLDSPAAIAKTGGSVSDVLLSPYWLISTYFTLTIAELFLSPMGLSFVAKVAPPKVKGLMQGGWLFATALGNYLSGVIAYPYEHLELWQTFLLLVITSLISAVFIFSVIRRLEAATKS